MKTTQALQNLALRLLKAFYIILPYTVNSVEEYRFNLLNPLGWVLLLCTCVWTGLYTMVSTGITVVKEALTAEGIIYAQKSQPVSSNGVAKKGEKIALRETEKRPKHP